MCGHYLNVHRLTLIFVQTVTVWDESFSTQVLEFLI